MLVLALVAVLIGATLQRASGTGVGLVVAPVMALLYGPAQGVLLTNAVTTFSGFLLLLAVRREVDWAAYRSLGLWSLPGACIGAILVRELPEHLLQVIIGVVVLVALLLSVAVPGLPRVRSPWARRMAGLIGGGFNTTAGVAAPAMVVYANLSKWGQVSFAATMQPTFMTLGLVSVILKSVVFPVPGMGLPPWWMLPALAGTVLAGSLTGKAVSHWLSARAARRLAITSALVGGLLVVDRGLGWA